MTPYAASSSGERAHAGCVCRAACVAGMSLLGQALKPALILILIWEELRSSGTACLSPIHHAQPDNVSRHHC